MKMAKDLSVEATSFKNGCKYWPTHVTFSDNDLFSNSVLCSTVNWFKQ